MAVTKPPATRGARPLNYRQTPNTAPVGIEDKNVESALRRLSEVVERREGRLGDRSEAAVTWADLERTGIVKESNGGASGVGFVATNQGDSFRSFMCPPQGFSAPTNFRLTVNGDTVTLSWDIAQSCTIGAFEVWRGVTPNLSEATLIGSVFGRVYADVGLLRPVAGGANHYYYWVRALDINGTPSAFSDPDGLKATVYASLPDQMAALDERIGKRLLDTGLTSSIDRIDGPATTPGTLNWEINQRTTAIEGLTEQTKQWVGFQTLPNGQTTTAVIQQQARISTVEGQLNSSYGLKIDNGKVAGFQLNNNTGQPSSFDILADEFTVSSRAVNGTTVTPFKVVGNRVWINEAAIQNATIDAAKIGTGHINNATIGAANIVGDASIGGNISSSSYLANLNRGWKLFSDGSAYFGNTTTFAGQLNVASQDSTGRVTINSQGIRVFDSGGRMRIAIGKL